MDEVIAENLPNLANIVLTYGSKLLIAAGQDPIAIAAVALIVVLLAVRMVKRKRGVFRSSRPRGSVSNKRASSPTVKPCPNCAEQLPITAIICGICDYNFLAERPGRGQKLLSSPQAMAQEMLEQKIVSTELIKPRETFGTVH
jgi:hypothetical protein